MISFATHYLNKNKCLSNFSLNINWYSDLDSTNIRALADCKQNIAKEGDVYACTFQKKGKGQGQNLWHSTEGNNLLFSLVVRPEIAVDMQFFISQVVALGIKNYLDSLSVNKATIKWPNDILIDGKKVAGILIENILSGDKVNYSVIGIGLNVNQQKFPKFRRAATSIAIEKEKEFDLNKELEMVLQFIQKSYQELFSLSVQKIKLKYLNALYLYNQQAMFQLGDKKFSAKIINVEKRGHLVLSSKQGVKSYDLKEISFIN